MIKIRFLHNSLLIDNSVLVFGDFHIGFEEHISTESLFPRIQLKDDLQNLEKIFKKLKDEKIKLSKLIILGDLKHEFGGISDSEWRDVLKLLDYLEDKLIENIKFNNNYRTLREGVRESKAKKSERSSKIININNLNSKKLKDKYEIILIKGNHDTILGPIAKKKNIKLKNYYNYSNFCFIHGNKWFKNKACEKSKILIIGHLHPAVTLSDKYKKEKYKCFLFGKWKKKQVYVLPSFSSISFGYDLIKSKYDKNYSEKHGFLIINEKQLQNFKVLIYNNKEDKILNFGVLKRLKK